MDTIAFSQADISLLAWHLARTPVLFGGKTDKLILGNNVSLVNALLNVASGTITIGDDTFFGHNVCILAAGHPHNGERQENHTEGYDILIGKNVWIASNVTILGPCTIGDNAIIAAGSVVTKNVKGNWVYAGVPARKLKKV